MIFEEIIREIFNLEKKEKKKTTPKFRKRRASHSKIIEMTTAGNVFKIPKIKTNERILKAAREK